MNVLYVSGKRTSVSWGFLCSHFLHHFILCSAFHVISRIHNTDTLVMDSWGYNVLFALFWGIFEIFYNKMLLKIER